MRKRFWRRSAVDSVPRSSRLSWAQVCIDSNLRLNANEPINEMSDWICFSLLFFLFDGLSLFLILRWCRQEYFVEHFVWLQVSIQYNAQSDTDWTPNNNTFIFDHIYSIIVIFKHNCCPTFAKIFFNRVLPIRKSHGTASCHNISTKIHSERVCERDKKANCQRNKSKGVSRNSRKIPK